MPWPFKSYRRKTNSLPEFTEDLQPEVSEDEELESITGHKAPAVTVTLGAQDRYRKMLEKGPDKPGIGRILLAAGLGVAGSMKSRPDTQQELDRQTDDVLGRRQWRERIQRAGEEADVEKGQQAQAEREREHKASERIRQDTLETNAHLRNKADETAKANAETRADSLKHRAATEQETNLSRQGYFRLEDGQAPTEGWEIFTTKAGQKYQRPPLSERRGDTKLPSWIVKAYPDEKLDTERLYPKHEVDFWIKKYQEDQQTKRNNDDNKARAEASRNNVAWERDDQERRERIRNERQAKENEGKYKATLGQLEASYGMRERTLQNEWRKRFAKDENGVALTPDKVEARLWNSPEFIAQRQALFDEWVQQKNLAAERFQAPHRYGRMDGKTGKEVGQSVQQQGGAAPQSQGEMEKPSDTEVASAKDGTIWVIEGTGKQWVKRGGKLVLEDE